MGAQICKFAGIKLLILNTIFFFFYQAKKTLHKLPYKLAKCEKTKTITALSRVYNQISKQLIDHEAVNWHTPTSKPPFNLFNDLLSIPAFLINLTLFYFIVFKWAHTTQIHTIITNLVPRGVKNTLIMIGTVPHLKNTSNLFIANLHNSKIKVCVSV